MKDYKHVKVPRKYRVSAPRTKVNRVRAATGRGSGKDAAGLKSAVIKIFIVIMIGGGSYLGWQAYRMLTHADIFQISGMDVKGVRHLDEKDLRSIAGVFTGQNIFRVDFDEAVRRAEAIPWVKDVKIYRRLPNRISVVITERTPAAVLDTGKAQYLLGSDMVVIGRVAKDDIPSWRLPCITAKDLKAVPGGLITSAGVEGALVLLNELSGRGRWPLSDVTVKADAAETLSLLYGQNEFRIGTGNYGQKLRRLAEVAADLKERGVTASYIDLRPERQVAVMVKKDGVQGPGASGQ